MSEPSSAETAARSRRRYNSPVRREQVADTRSRILAAGSALVHEFPTWDWSGLTFRAVAARAGVSERTVYRHFATEQGLHDAVLRRVAEDAGISYDDLRLADLRETAERVYKSVSSFASRSPVESGFRDEDRKRRQAVKSAVHSDAEDWSDIERTMAAGVLDQLWGVGIYERLMANWGLSADEATRAVGWVIDLVVTAIRNDNRPPGPPGPARRRKRGNT